MGRNVESIGLAEAIRCHNWHFFVSLDYERDSVSGSFSLFLWLRFCGCLNALFKLPRRSGRLVWVHAYEHGEKFGRPHAHAFLKIRSFVPVLADTFKIEHAWRNDMQRGAGMCPDVRLYGCGEGADYLVKNAYEVNKRTESVITFSKNFFRWTDSPLLGSHEMNHGIRVVDSFPVAAETSCPAVGNLQPVDVGRRS